MEIGKSGMSDTVYLLWF